MLQISVRLPRSLLDRVEAEAERSRREVPGSSANRSDVVRELVHEGLDRRDEEKESRKARKRK